MTPAELTDQHIKELQSSFTPATHDSVRDACWFALHGHGERRELAREAVVRILNARTDRSPLR